MILAIAWLNDAGDHRTNRLNDRGDSHAAALLRAVTAEEAIAPLRLRTPVR